MTETCALIPAAGRGKRFSETQSKLFVELAGIPVLGRSLLAFQHCRAVRSIVLVVANEDRDAIARLADRLEITKLAALVEGGVERQDSVTRGLEALPESTRIVAVHDGVRPLVSSALIESCIEAADRWGAAVPALPITDTVKRADDERVVLETLDRSRLFGVQTPQTFRRELLEEAYRRAAREGFVGTDDSVLVERTGTPVHLVPGEASNIKVTTMPDIARAEMLLGVGPRIGFGYDIHRLEEGRKLFLGGVEIPHTKGLLGHSDADALLHALCDALLGAAGLADIGIHFPNTDPKYAGISSLRLLEEVAGMLGENGLVACNVDATVIAEAPKIAPYIAIMKERIAEALSIDTNRVGIKATTNEGLGSLGAGEGIAAYAVATLVGLTKGTGR